MSPDLHTLAGAYAVDALPPDERAAYEEHVQACPDCAQEVRELRATAARLAAASARTPPASLRGRVLAAIAAIRPLPPPAQPVAAPLRRLMPRLLAAAAAVALLVAGTFGVLALGADRRADRLALDNDRLTDVVNRLALDNDQLTDVLVASDARGIGGQVAGGGQATVMVSRDRGTVVLLADDLAAVAGDRDYQVWLIGPGGTRAARSGGLLDPDSTGDAMRLVEAPLADVTAVGLTVEPAGGSKRPTTRPVLLLRLPA